MYIRIILSVALILSASGHGWAAPQENLLDVLSFESPGLIGWSGEPRETRSADSVTVHGGRYSGRIDRSLVSDRPFTPFTMSLPVEFSGETLELIGWLRTEGVTDFAVLWLRQDGRGKALQFDNMRSRGIKGTTGWTRYSISLPLDERADTVFLGALLAGEGTMWVDDLRLLVDGTQVRGVSGSAEAPCAVELDTEFDGGSRVEVRDLTSTRVANLTLLGKVWGFAKYHHPRITGGEVNWDYELFRVLPAVLRARNRAQACTAMSTWLERLGDPDERGDCAELPAESHLTPDLGWISDRGSLGDALSERLQLIYDRRPANVEHYYVTHVPGVGNPAFSNEAGYPGQRSPDDGFGLLALYRFWNIVEYWFPYRDAIGENWDDVLAEFVPRVMRTGTADSYRLTMMELSARVNDTHANLWDHLSLRPPRGSSELPVVLRFIEGKAVVTGFSHEELGPATRLQIGDIVEQIDGRPIEHLVAEWRRYYSASNEPSLLRDIARNLTKGESDSVRITGTRPSGAFAVTAERAPIADLDQAAGRTHDLSGETFQLLSGEVAYLKLSSVVEANVSEYMAAAAGTDVLVVDIRNYPNEFVVFALGGCLVTEPTEFARITVGDALNPGAFLWEPPMTLEPLEPRFSGKVVVLVDEVSQSQAEYTAMALRAAPNAVVVGSMTTGADGNISSIPLPGGISSMISGIGVFYPDGTPTQRVGVVPDLEVRPTIAGVRAGRDEVLEAGVSFALGREFLLTER